jgi:TonB family protein
VEIVSGASDELNRMAIAAARKIKFDPARKDGVAVSVTKKVEYAFFTFYKENDPDLQANAEITRKPAPEYPEGNRFDGIDGKVQVTLNLLAGGKIEVDKIKSDLPPEFKDKARAAALKIKFKPAVAKNGRKVSQTKEIEYEFKSEND